MRRLTALLFLLFLFGCALALPQSENAAQDTKSKTQTKNARLRKVDPTDPEYQKEEEQRELERDKQTALATKLAEEETRIRKEETAEEHMERLVELLASQRNDAAPESLPERSKKSDSLTTQMRWLRMLKAFERLADYKAPSIPILVTHLDDNRPGIGLRSTHWKYTTVGNACYENIEHQLQDRPQDYARGVGFKRKGRDGEDHVTPYGNATPFGEFHKREARGTTASKTG